MKEEPVTADCAAILRAREHVVVGVSPFNSYFTEEKIAELINWAKENFRAFHLYVPDGPSRFTLEALGYSENRARKKASRQSRWLLNKIRRALCVAGIEEAEAEHLILCSKRLDYDDTYCRLAKEVNTICASDASFYEGCIETSRWVLNGQAGDPDEVTREMLESAVRYLKAELPLFMNSPAIVGAPSSVFDYHQCPPFLEELFQTRRGEIANQRQGFVKVTAT